MNNLFELDLQERRRFWNRLCRMGIVRERELVRVHRVAQTRRIAPEGALVEIGLLTAEQVAELLSGNAPFGIAMEGLGIA